MIRLVATDLDGTVVRHDGTISPRTLAALAAVEAAGLELVLVTGRPPRWMAEIVDMTGHRGTAVCGNGAFVYDLHTEQVLEQFLIDPATTLLVADRLRAALTDAQFAVETPNGFAREPGYRTRWDARALAVDPLADLVAAGPVAKLLVRDETSTGDAMLAVARETVGHLVEVTHSNVNDCLLEISARGVSKATTLARVAAERGVGPAEVLAFGDMPNDLPMLAWAGTAYAVADAHPEVLAAVPAVTAGVDEDGVARVLEELLAGYR